MKKALVLAALGAAVLCGQNKKIVVVGMGAAEINQLKQASPKADIVATTREKLIEEAVDADAILGGINPAIIRAAKKLRWVQVFSAGVEGYRSPELLNSPITLTNEKIIQGPNIADHAFALLLSLTRQLYRTIPTRTQERWQTGTFDLIELRGKTAVIIGLGGIGMQIAQRAHGFDMTVIGVDPKDISYTSMVSKVVRPDQLDTVLPLADVVFISAPHTPESQGMMGPRQFDLMKKNSYFIAVSRGKVYDTDALVKALDSKRLAGAGLDVTNPEPLPPGHPLWKFENVVITPHLAGHSDQLRTRSMELLKENIRRFADGEPLLNVVDKQKGY